MKISQKLENACRVLAALARQHDGQRVFRVDDLARAEGLSAAFLHQVLQELRRAGLVASRRGKAGGFMLARPPLEISLGDVARAVEGRFFEMDTKRAGGTAARVAEVWNGLSRQFEGMLDGVSLAEIAAGAEDGGQMFYI